MGGNVVLLMANQLVLVCRVPCHASLGYSSLADDEEHGDLRVTGGGGGPLEDY